MSTYTYISPADTAKLVRTALKQRFPGVKFSVRTSVYAGGASIDVRWYDGPLDADVSAVVDQYRGADFDGMIDLKTNRTVLIATDPGQLPIEVSYGADYIHTNRRISDKWRVELIAEFEAVTGEPFDETRYCAAEVDRDGQVRRCENTREYADTILWRMAAHRSR